MQNVVGPTLDAMATKFETRRRDPVAYRLVYMFVCPIVRRISVKSCVGLLLVVTWLRTF